MNTPRRLVRSVLAWPVESQQGSRRNALIATTALTQLRRERDDVEDFLAEHQWQRTRPLPVVEEQGARRDVI